MDKNQWASRKPQKPSGVNQPEQRIPTSHQSRSNLKTSENRLFPKDPTNSLTERMNANPDAGCNITNLAGSSFQKLNKSRNNSIDSGIEPTHHNKDSKLIKKKNKSKSKK